MKGFICYDKTTYPSNIFCKFYMYKDIMGFPHKSPIDLTCFKKKPSKQYKIHVIYPCNKLIHRDPIACARYYIIKGFVYVQYSTNTHILLEKPTIFLVIEFQNHGGSMTIAFYGLKIDSYLELIQVKELKKLWTNIFHVIFQYYQLHYKIHNINTFEPVRKKSCYFYIPLSITSHEYNKNIT